jgi:DNA-binding MarR family transcriptional regulator
MADIKDIWVYANNIIRISRQMINEELKPLNLSSAEGNILLHLLTQDEPITQEELVEQLEISKPAVSRALKSLQKKRFVLREKSPLDRRAFHVRLSSQAQEIGPELEQIYNNVFSVAATVVTEEEVAGFIDLFERVSDSFMEARRLRKTKGVWINAE